MTVGRLISWAALATLTTACGGAEATPRTGGVIDSVLPRDTAIARFQRVLPRVDSLSGGAHSRDELVRRFVAALETRDTASLGSLILNQPEFGWLYYPTHPERLPPYNLTPQLMWFILQGNSNKGYARLLTQRSGQSLGFVGHRCQADSSRQGENTVWGPCVVLRRVKSGEPVAERLFGQIVERGRRYKFVSYANKL